MGVNTPPGVSSSPLIFPEPAAYRIRPSGEETPNVLTYSSANVSDESAITEIPHSQQY